MTGWAESEKKHPGRLKQLQAKFNIELMRFYAER